MLASPVSSTIVSVGKNVSGIMPLLLFLAAGCTLRNVVFLAAWCSRGPPWMLVIVSSLRECANLFRIRHAARSRPRHLVNPVLTHINRPISHLANISTEKKNGGKRKSGCFPGRLEKYLNSAISFVSCAACLANLKGFVGFILAKAMRASIILTSPLTLAFFSPS